MANNERHRDAVEQIDQIRREIEHAENEGDPSFIDEYCTEDVVGIPPEQPPSLGRDAGKEALEDLWEAFDVEVQYQSEDVVVGEELAVERLTATETHIPKHGGESIEYSVDSLWVYRRSPDGEWKQSHAIWNYRD